MTPQPKPEPKGKFQATKWLSYLSQWLLYIIGVLVLFLCYAQYRWVGWDWRYWDWMLLSGLLVFILALYLVRTIPTKMAQALIRLENRGAFVFSDNDLDDFQAKMLARGKRFGRWFSVFVGVIIPAVFWIAFRDKMDTRALLVTLETLLGLVAGYYIGLMVAYGTLGQLAMVEKVEIVSQPGHIDRTAGLKPIGDHYFFQAMIVALPCAFIAVWWFIIPIQPEWKYAHWGDSYLILLIIALVFEILSFIWPMWAFHLIMRKEKQEHLEQADEISQKISQLENKIMATDDSKLAGELQKQQAFLEEKYWEIENMPTWPVDRCVRRRFTYNNLALFSPLVLDLLKTTDPIRKFLDLLVEWLKEPS